MSPGSETAALLERLMEIHSNPPIIYYVGNVNLSVKMNY